jgi:cytochrome b involved in lipid metabolism
MDTGSSKEYTYEDVRNHRTSSDGWIAVHGQVYDITKFIKTHPGGQIILTALGRDATILFESHHNLLDTNSMKDWYDPELQTSM